MDDFKFDVGDVVLAEWEDKLFYAKIQKIDKEKSYCHLIFDDNSVEDCPFSKIHSVTETTAEIVCIICKDGVSAEPNEIVLCDKCGIGYHQKCHEPPIPAKALELDEPWMCTYCCVGAFCPYLENPFEAKDKRNEPLRRRRIHPLNGENSVVTSTWNSRGHCVLANNQVNHGMSGFYYSSPSQHREGSRPRGRPPFSHKKHMNEKRGRGIGKSPNRNQTRERDHHQKEREVEQEMNSRKHYNKHSSSDMQHRNSHSLYSSPSRNSRHNDEVDSSGSDRSQNNKETEKNSTNKSLSAVKHHRRDPPREKQRLTQDLARQKKLLSEDIARNHILQSNQITKNDTGDGKDTESDSDHCNSVKDTKDCMNDSSQLTMYEKCYGNSAATSPGDDFTDESQPQIQSRSDNAEISLFERIINRSSVEETKHNEFINERQLEMKSDEERNDIDHVITKPLSTQSDITSKGDLNRKVKLPVFENVTDDELTMSDNDASAHSEVNSHVISSNAIVTNAEIVSTVNCYSSSKSLNNHISPKEISTKEHFNDFVDKHSCECSTREGSDNEARSFYHGDDAKEVLRTNHQPDDSAIKASKILQILDEPDMQCEHSLKNENLTRLRDHNEIQNGSNITKDSIENKAVINSITNEYVDSNHQDEALDEFENSKEQENVSMEQDTDVSNNEGMSDAEELSDLEPVTSSGKAKIKRKTRKKSKTSKSITKMANSPQRQSRRSKTGRRLGRPPKINKQIRQINSDSDEQDNMNMELKVEGKEVKSSSPSNELISADSTQESYKLCDSTGVKSEYDVTKGDDVTDENIDMNGGEEGPLSPESLLQQDSDTEDANQDIFSLTETERLHCEEQGRRERARRDKRIAARQKRKSIDRDREKERSTPPHLISQNRFARDLPRHNWLVERLLQQNKLGQEALKQDEDNNSDMSEDNADEEVREKAETLHIDQNIDIELDSKVKDKAKDAPPECAEFPKDEPSSPTKDDFQSELHRSFLRRSFPPNVPRSPPKLKPASPDSNTSSENKSFPPPLKHKLHSKENSVLEPVPKLKKIVPEKAKEAEDSTVKEQGSEESELHKNNKDSESSGKQQSPIEILDDEEEKKKNDIESDSKQQKSSTSPIAGLMAKDEESKTKRSSFSPPKKPLFPSSKKIVHSVSPTLPGSGKDMPSPHPMGPHHRAAILIPVVPMHDANSLPLPPSLGPPSPHMKPYSPRTFTPHLITHNPPFSSAGLFSGPSPNRYPAGSCHHFHPGLKPGPCKRDVNCPFHGSHNRTIPSGILGIPSHHPGSMAAFNSPHDHISQMIAREREHREGHCPNSDCKLCRQGKESPKIRELDSQSCNDKKSPQPAKVVKPIAHVPGMRPPLMLSHLQQFGMRPGHNFSDIDTIQEEKARRSGLDPLSSPRAKLGSTSPDRPSREPLVPGMFHHERRSLPQSLTLSDLNRRREQEFLKGSQESISKRRPLPGEFVVPGFSPPSSLSKAGLIHPKDSTLFSTVRNQPIITSHSEKRDNHRLEDRERSAFLPDPLKAGPPRLRPLDEKMDVHVLRNLNEQKGREEMSRREGAPTILSVPTSKEGNGMPPAKLFEDREVARDQAHDQPLGFSRPNKEFDMRLLSSHGNSSILGPGMRNIEESRKISEEERKGLTRDERHENEARRAVESETREREIREEQAMNALEASHRRSIEQMREKEQEKRAFVERDAMRGLTPLERDRMKQQLLRGPEGEKHFKPTFSLPRERSPPFLRRDMFQERLIDPSKADHRLDLRSAPLYDLQRRQELFRASEGSHRELLGRIASSYSANKTGHPADKHFSERFLPEFPRSLAEIGGHSPTRGYPLSLASRQAMDRLAAAAQGKSIPLNKELDKEIPLHLRTEMEREREKERHRLSLEQIDVNRRLLQAELKEKVNPLVLNREIGPRDREKEMAALRARERLMIERERHMAFERLVEDRRRKRDTGEPEGPFLTAGRHIPSPPYSRALNEFERAKRMRLDDQILPPSSYNSLMTSQAANSFESKGKDDRLASPKGGPEQRLVRPLELELPNKNSSSMFDREALWLRERERVMRAKEELNRLQPKVSHSHTSHLPAAFVTSKERSEDVTRDSENSSGKQPEDDSVNLCSVCKREASFLCSGCQGAWYCSTDCQLSAWSKHSRDCGQSQRQ